MHFGHQGTDSREETGVSYSLMKRWWKFTSTRIELNIYAVRLDDDVDQIYSVVVI